ncbi:MAG TPA: hypothetical protein VGJ90_04150 [Methylophilaceae bacterium]|jgi:hypothetical protein
MIIKRFLTISTYISVLLSIPNAALADVHICSLQDAKVAESAATTAKTWVQLHKQFKLYAHCDDASIAEGFSESVSVLLTERWKSISQLGKLIKSDPDFGKFVIKHIDETVPEERLNQIAENAQSCPKSLKALCHDINAAASQK